MEKTLYELYLDYACPKYTGFKEREFKAWCKQREAVDQMFLTIDEMWGCYDVDDVFHDCKSLMFACEHLNTFHGLGMDQEIKEKWKEIYREYISEVDVDEIIEDKEN